MSDAEEKTVRMESEDVTHPRLGTLFASCTYAIAIAGGIGFLFVYWHYDKTHWDAGNTMLLGASLALLFGGAGAGLVLQARWLTRHEQVTEPREILPSPPEEREAAMEAFEREHQVERRGLLIGAGIAVLGLFAAAFVSVLRSLARNAPGPSLYTTVWRRGQRLVTHDGKLITLDSLQVGSTAVVFPEDAIGDEKAQTVLVRVREEFLRLPEERSDWAPGGYLAYSRVCTHAGCPVGMYEATTDLLMCPCHQSTFDVLRGAEPTGGPAVRPLPQLPLYADENRCLRAAGGFSNPPGPGFWGMPT